jgi:uncharacterized membrane protein YeaQ/YmgE (transglycosylase-associated protein family)
MTLFGFLLLVVVGAICGAVAEMIVGYRPGGFLASVAIGFVGAWIGGYLAGILRLPTMLVVHIEGHALDVAWTVLGSIVLLLVVSLFRRTPFSRRRYGGPGAPAPLDPPPAPDEHPGMEITAFLAELDREVERTLGALAEAAGAAEPAPEIGVPQLLVAALKKELEASEEAALWMTREPDVEVKLGLARQCGDEAKHYRLIEARLVALGVDTARLRPLDGGPSPMFTYLAGLETTVERVAAGQFTREALAKVHNDVFIAWCEAHGDAETARLYREVIQPDEGHHHAMGRQLLARLAVTEEAQTKARAASARTLAIAGEIQEMARLKKGIARAPGC